MARAAREKVSDFGESMSLVPISEVFDAARAHCRINDVNFKHQRLLLTPSWLSAC
jgi:hypothetical protein